MDDDAEISRVIRENGVGWQCKPADPRVLADVIATICSSDLAALTGCPLAVFRENYAEDLALNKFYANVADLIGMNKL
jgi:hypothetical protein